MLLLIECCPLSSTDSLKQLIEKPPIGGKELNPLTQSQLVGFRLHPGPLPEKYRAMHLTVKKKHKHKKSKSKGAGDVTPSQDSSLLDEAAGKTPKHGKKRKHDDDKERKKKKKDKKRKKQKLSPERTGILGSDRSV